MKELQSGRKITAHLVKTLQQILLTNVRHKGGLGVFRKKPVWIAEKAGDPIEKAVYVPPEYFLVEEYVDDLFKYVEDGKENTLIKSGIVHYQFEAIHPFEDGNGRIGRLLIPLVLYYRAKLSKPILYLSGYFDEHRDEYLNALHSVDESGKYEPWLAFFFASVTKQLQETQKLVDGIYKLYGEVKEGFVGIKSPYLHAFLDFLFKAPIFTSRQAERDVKATPLTVARLLKLFQSRNLVLQLPFRRGRFKLYRFKPLLDLL